MPEPRDRITLREELMTLAEREGLSSGTIELLFETFDVDSLASERPKPVEPEGTVAEERYEVLSLLGRGGMGEVLRVRDRVLERTVALKRLRPDRQRSRNTFTRFREEAQVTAQLEHPGILPVYDLAEDAAGRLHYTMKEVHGLTLGEAVEAFHEGDGSLSLLGLVDVFARACSAVGFAHSRGVVHRDLKPDNVLLGQHGEVLVVDWGLVKVVGAEDRSDPVRVGHAVHGRTETQDGVIMGTPGFMAPEQWVAIDREIDPRTDVYALGVVLQVILTGAYPPPVYPEEGPLVWVSDPPVGLRHVVERATSWSPEDRHADAQELSVAVREWLEGARRAAQAQVGADLAEQVFAELPDAQKPSARELLLRLVKPDGKSNPLPRSSLEAVGAGLAGAMATLVEAGVLRQEDGGAHAVVAVALPDLGLTWGRLAGWIDGDREGSRLRHRLLTDVGRWVEEGHPTPWWDLRDAEALRERASLDNILLAPDELAFLDEALAAGVRARRRRRIALGVAVALLVSGMLTTGWLWRRAESARAQAEVARVAAEVRALVARANHQEATGAPLAALALLRVAVEVAGTQGVPAAPVERALAQLAARDDASWVLPAHGAGAFALAWDAPGARLVTGGADGAVRLWEPDTGRLLHEREGLGSDVDQVAFSPDGGTVTASGRGVAPVEFTLQSPGPEGAGDTEELPQASRVRFTDDGRWTVSVTRAGDVRVRSRESGQELAQHQTAPGRALFAVSSVSDRMAVLAGRELQLFGLPGLDPLGAHDLAEPVRDLLAFPAGDRLLAVGLSGRVRVLSWTDGSVLVQLDPAEMPITVMSAALSSDGERAALASHGGEVLVFDTSTGALVHRLSGHADVALALAFTPDGRWLATGSEDSSIRLWEVSTGQLGGELNGHKGGVRALGWRPDGRTLASAALDGTVRIWRPSIVGNTAAVTCRGSEQVDLFDVSSGADLAIIQGFGEQRLCAWRLGEEGTVPLESRLDEKVVVGATRSDRFVTADRSGGRVRSWDAESFAVTGAQPLAVGVHTVGAWESEGPGLWTLSPPCVLSRWGLDGLRSVPSEHCQEPFYATRLTADPARVAVLSKGTGGISVIDGRDGSRVLHVGDGHAGSHSLPSFDTSQEAGLLASGHRDGRVRLWRLDDGEPVAELVSGEVWVHRVAFDRTGDQLAVASTDGRLQIWGVSDQALIHDLGTGPGAVSTLAWDPPGELLAVQFAGGQLAVWRTDTGEPVRSWHSRAGRFDHLAFFGRSRLLSRRGHDGVAQQWVLPDVFAAAHPGGLTNLRVCPGGEPIVAVVPFPGPDQVWAGAEDCPQPP